MAKMQARHMKRFNAFAFSEYCENYREISLSAQYLLFRPGPQRERRGDGGRGPGVHRVQRRHRLDAGQLLLGHPLLLHAHHPGHRQVRTRKQQDTRAPNEGPRVFRQLFYYFFIKRKT